MSSSPQRRRRRIEARRGANAQRGFAHAAAAAGQADRVRWHATRGRAIPTKRDETLVKVQLSRGLVAEIRELIRRDSDLLEWIDTKVAATRVKPGAPVQMPLETFLVGCCLQVLVERNLHLINLPTLLGSLHPEDRRALGVDIINRRTGQPGQLT